LLILSIFASLVALLLFNKEAVEDQKFFKFLFPLQLSEELLCMRTCLCTSSSADKVLDLDPIFAEDFETFDELFVLLLGPAAPMCVDLLFENPLCSYLRPLNWDFTTSSRVGKAHGRRSCSLQSDASLGVLRGLILICHCEIG